MPASLLKPFVSLLRKYFLVVLFVTDTSLTLDGTSLLIFSFSHSGGKTSVFNTVFNTVGHSNANNIIEARKLQLPNIHLCGEKSGVSTDCSLKWNVIYII